MHTYLKVTNNQNTESNPNIVICKQGHLCFNIHPTKRTKMSSSNNNNSLL